MHAPPFVFRRTTPLCCLAHHKHLHLFVVKPNPPPYWRIPPHCLDTTLLRANHLHNVASHHHSCRDPHHYTSHRLLRAPATSRRSGLSRILSHHETLTLGCRCSPYKTLALWHCCRLCETLTLGCYCSPCETLTLGHCCRLCKTLALGRHCNPCETLALGSYCRLCETLALGRYYSTTKP